MLSLLSVNIEGKRHLDKIERLLEKVRPDIVCMQEVFVDDVPRLSDALARATDASVTVRFTPIVFKTADGVDKTADEIATGTHELIEFGNLIMTTLPAAAFQEQYYYGDRAHLHVHRSDILTDVALVLSSLVVEKDGEAFQVATTHFCKNHEGNITSDFQREQAVRLLQSLDRLGNFIVCGDFNAPRGGEIFTMLAERYKDNINPSYTSSLDPDLHRAGPLPFMVDGLFTTPEYKVTHMHFETGVSDHYAIVATIECAAQ
jgi:endonuclease/exonuclease/phosphatase family metal-dependent hydrolase